MEEEINLKGKEGAQGKESISSLNIPFFALCAFVVTIFFNQRFPKGASCLR
jgi:hypothetical protein